MLDDTVDYSAPALSQPIPFDWTCIETLLEKQEQRQRLVDVYSRQIVASRRESYHSNIINDISHHDRHQQIQQQREVVVISGPSGVGKTCLALTLEERVMQDGGYFCRGKFDQPRRMMNADSIIHDNNSNSTFSSYGPFVTAITELVETTVQRCQGPVLSSIQSTLEHELDSSELQVLEESIPALRKITKPPSTGLSAANEQEILHWHGLKGLDAEKRYMHIICKLVRALCSSSSSSDYHPWVIMLIDDLQWADRNSLHLLKYLVHNVSTGFLLVATARLHEVPVDGPLHVLLSDWNETGSNVAVAEVQVGDMTEQVVNELVSHELHLPEDNTKPLSKLVHNLTRGNLFFVVQFTSVLNQEGHLYINSDTHQWCWDEEQIAKAFPSNLTVLDFFVLKITKLSDYEQQVLKIASCLGGTIYECLLLETAPPSTGVRAALLTAMEHGLVIFPVESGSGRFVHDRIQEAAYSLIPEQDRATMHLDIGLRLWTWLKGKDRDKHLFTLANQIIRGIHLFDDPVEKKELAALMLRAGEKASLLSSFTTAASYFDVGISLLPREPWKHQYSLCLSLYNAAAEVEYYNGNTQRVDMLLEEIFSHAKSLDHKLRAHFTQIYSLYSRDEMRLAFAKGLQVLRLLGVTFPRRVGRLDTAYAWGRCQWLLRGMSDDHILMHLPLMKDNRQLVIMRLLTLMVTGAFITRQEYFPLMVTRMIEYTLRHGISAICCYSFALFGFSLGRRGKIEEEYRFGRLAVQMMNKFQTKEWNCRVAVALVYCVKNKLRDQIKPLQSAHRAGLVAGDIHYSMVSASIQCRLCFFASDPLPDVVRILEDYRKLCEQYGQQSVSIMLTHQLQGCLNFMGRSADPLVLTGDVMNEKEAIIALEEQHPVSLTWLTVMKHMLAVYFNNVQEARTLSVMLGKMQTGAILPFVLQNHLFLEGLAAATLSRSDKSQLRHARQSLDKLKAFTPTPCTNFENKICLVEAELSACRGDRDLALAKYQQSIEAAKREGFLHEQALACEKAGNILLEWSEH